MENMKSLATVENEVKKELELVVIIAENAGKFEIKDDAGVQIAKDSIVELRRKSQEIEKIRLATTKPLDEMKRAIKGEYDKPIALLKDALATYSMKMQVWLAEQVKIADKEARRLQAIADEIARKEKEKLEKKAVKAEESGKPEQAEALREQKEMVAPVVPAISVGQQLPKGSYMKKIWTAQIIDVNQIPREYMIPNVDGLNKIASATKGTLKIAGVVFKCEEKLINRS